MSPRTGRPPLEHPRRKIERFRVTDAEHELLATSAEHAGVPLADWLRARALTAAKRAAR
jgi:hypothetical protein